MRSFCATVYFDCNPVRGQWSLYVYWCVPPDFTFKDPTVCLQNSFALCISYDSHSTDTSFPYTQSTRPFCNRGGMCLLRGTNGIFKYNAH